MLKIRFYQVIFIFAYLLSQCRAYSETCLQFPEDRASYCNHVSQHCSDPELIPGRLNYLYFTYCTCSGLEWLGFSIISLLLVVCFIVSATISADFVLPNIATISECFKIPAAISGVTLIAIGNTLPDLIGNVVALRSPGSEGIAIGNTFGSVMFSLMMTFSMLSIVLNGQRIERSVMFSLIYIVVAVVAIMLIMFDSKIIWLEISVLFVLYIIYITGILWIENRKKPRESALPVSSNHNMSQILASHVETAKSLINFSQNKSMVKSTQILEYLFQFYLPKCFRMSFDTLLLGLNTLSRFQSHSINFMQKHKNSMSGQFKVEMPDKSLKSNLSIEYCPCCRQIKTDAGFRKLLKYHLFPIFSTWKLHSLAGKIFSIITSLPRFVFSLVTVVIGPPLIRNQDLQQDDDSTTDWHHMYITLFQVFITPLFIVSAAHSPMFNLSPLLGLNDSIYLPLWVPSLFLGFMFACVTFFLNYIDKKKGFVRWLSIPGLCVSLTWAYLASMETISLLKTIGLVAGLSDELLGLTFLVFGNNFGDLVSSWVATKIGMNEMVLNSATGQPVLVLLFNMATIVAFMATLNGGKVMINTTIPVVIAVGSLICWITGTLFFYAINGSMLSRKHGILGIFMYAASIIFILLEQYLTDK